MNTNFCFYNCTGTISYLSLNSADYVTAAYLYESPTIKITFSDKQSTSSGEQCFFGGGPYSTSYVSFNTTVSDKQSFNKVYWGTFDKNMNPTAYLYDTNKIGAEQDSSQNNAWVVYQKMPDPNSGEVKVNGEDSTLAKALANAVSGDVIVLQRDIAIEADLTVSTSASNVLLDLNGWQLTGSNAIINNGDMEIIDVNGNGQIDIPIINNGTLLLSSAKYNGLITLKGGYCYFLAGTFNGGVSVASNVADPTSVAEIYGGTYTPTTYTHGAQTKDLVGLCDNGYVKDGAIAQIPVSQVSSSSFASYSLSALSSSEQNLYTRGAARSGYTREEWITLNKLKASANLFGGFGVDCAVTLDRDIAANDFSITAMGLYTFNVDVAISANNWYSALFQAMRASGQASAPWTYGSLLPGGEHAGTLSFSLSNKTAQNGTFCLVEMRLATGIKNLSGPKDWSYTEYVTTAERKLVLGAGTSNKAMIRPATGAATFYSTLGAAMNAVADGGTVMLANDCDTALPITKVGTYTFDTMGFAHSSDISVADGLVIKSTTAADSSVKAFIPDAIATTYEVVQTVAKVGDQSFYNLTDAVAVALSSGEVVTLLADTDEAVVLNKGQALKLAIASGVNYDAASKITCSDDKYIIQATAQSGYTLYKPKYNSNEIVQIGEDYYSDLPTALTAVKSGDTVRVLVDCEVEDDATIPYGATLVVSTDVTLTVASGKTLWIDGDATINGAISGTYSKCTKLFYQEGENGEPFCPYKDDDRHNKDDEFVIKYWKTKISTLSSLSGASSHTTIQNGYGDVAYHGATATAFICKVDNSVAINHITEIVSAQTSAKNAYDYIEDVALAQQKPYIILLTANATTSSTRVSVSGNITKRIVVDGASAYGITFSATQVCDPTNGWAQRHTSLTFINCTSATSPKLTDARATFINCTTPSVGSGSNANSASYMTSVHIYDSPLPSISFASNATTLTKVGAGVCVFSGGAFSVATSANYHYYGGYYSADPSARLYDTNYVKAEKGDPNKGENANYWYVKPVLPTVYVAQVGSEQFETVQEAVNAAGNNGGTVELLLALATDGLAEPITVAAGKTVTIDLKGLAFNAPNGAFINNGTLFLKDTTSSATPGSVTTGTTTGKNLIVNNGTLDITYGTYNGNILLNAGTFTTHGGAFTGTLTAASGADPKEVANLRGGEFTQNVTSFLRDGYFQQGGWVGIFPAATTTATTLSGAEAAWKLTFISSADKTLYAKGREGQTSLEDLQKYAELASSLNPYLEYTPEGVAIFDRAVSGGTVSFYGSANNISLPAQTLDSDVAANGSYRMLIKLLKQNVPTPYTYKQYINDVSALLIGIKSNNSNNNGTVATIELQFWRPDGSTQGEYTTAGLAPLARTRYMLGEKKAAIDRNGSRSAYDSLSAAVSAAQSGETVLVGADTAENVTLPGAGTFTIDPYGFNWTGSALVGQSYLYIQSRTEVASLADAQGVASAKAITYVVAAREITAGMISVEGATFTGEDLTPAVTVTDAETTLVLDTDYTVSYSNNRNVGTAKVTVTGIGSYTGSAEKEFAIAPKAVTVKADNGSKTYGAAEPQLTATVTGLVGSDTISYGLTRASGEVPGEYVITVSGAATQGNYTVSYETGTFTITRKGVTVTAADDLSKIYGAADPTFTATAEGVIGSDTVEYTFTREEGENVGEYVVTPTGEAVQGNYSVSYAPGKLTIAAKPVTITVASASKVYGEADPTFTGTVEGLVNATDLGTVTYSRTGSDANVGTYTGVLTANYTANSNYAVTVVPGNFEITAAKVAVPTAASSLVYDGTEKTGVAGGTGYTLSGTTTATAAGSYTATATLAANYVWSDDSTDAKSIEWSIGKATVAVTAEAKIQVYGTEAVALTYTAGDLVAGNSFSGSLAREAGDNVGTYAITQGTLSAGDNYTINFTGANYTITAIKIAVPTAVSGLIYNGTEQTGVAAGTGYTLSGNTATAAGSYTATATLEANYAWSDDSTAAKTITWSIGAAAAMVVQDDTSRYFATLAEAVEAADGAVVTLLAATDETITLAGAGDSFQLTVADGVTFDDSQITSGEGTFLVATEVDGVTTYEAKKITVEMAEPQAAVEVSIIENGVTNKVSDTALVEAAVAQLVGNGDVPRTDNTDKLDVLDMITVTPTKIVEEVVGGKTIIRAATFDVVRNLKAGQTPAEGQTFKFRLPVEASATQPAAIVYHGAAQFGIYAVQTENEEKFIEVASADFSPYGYTLLDGETANPVTAIGTTGYASLAAAVTAAQAGDTIEMLADDRVSLTSKQEIEITKGLTITGPVDANGDPLYTIHGTPTYGKTGEYNDIYITGIAESATVTISNVKFAEFGNQVQTGDNAVIYVGGSTRGKIIFDNVFLTDFNRTGITFNRSASGGQDYEVKNCYIDCTKSTDYGDVLMTGIENQGYASGTIKDTVIVGVNSTYADWSSAGISVLNNANVIVDGCSIEGSTDGIACQANSNGDAPVVTVRDTVIDVDGDALNAAVYNTVTDSETCSLVNVESGTYLGGLEAGGTGAGRFSISGGTFDEAVPEAYCAAGYIPSTTEVEGVTLYTVTPGYKVTFVDEDGETEFFATNVAVGASATYGGETPVKAATAQYTYTWTGWTYNGTAYGTSATLAPVADAAQTYTATYSSEVNNYTVTVTIPANTTIIVKQNGATIQPDAGTDNQFTVPYGTVLTVEYAASGAYVAGGTQSQTVTADSDKTVAVPNDYATTAAVAQIGQTYYTTLFAAVSAAQSGDTITLLADVETSLTIGKSLTLAGAHKITGTMTVTGGATVAMNGVTLDANGTIYALNITAGATVGLTNVMVGGGQWCNIHVNGGSLEGSGITMLGDEIVVAADGQTYTYRGDTFPKTDAPWGLDVSKIPGKTLHVPYMDIVRATGAETVSLSDPLTPAGSILFVANMPEDETQTGVALPERFTSYTLTLDADIDFFGGAEKPVTGWTVGNWNDFIDTGAIVLVAIDENPEEVPVVLELNDDTDLGDSAFEFRYPNLTVDGNGNALSGTVVYTDDAGVVSNAVLGTADSPLVIDLTHVTDIASLGDGIVVGNVTLRVSESHAADGTEVFAWDPDDGSPSFAQGGNISVVVVDANGEPTGDDATLSFDMEEGVAYLGTCVARLTGPTHDKPIYSSLYGAVSQAAQSGDTITLLADVETSLTIGKSLTLVGEHKITGTLKVTDGATVGMTGVTLDAAGTIYALDIVGGATVGLTNVTVGGGQWCNIHVNGGTLEGSGITMLGDALAVSADGQSYTYRGETHQASDAPFGMDLSKVKGETVTLPFMDIVREHGEDPITLDEPLTQAGSILFVANMPGDETLTDVSLPERFCSYTLTLGVGIGFLGDAETPTTGWAAGDWNEIVDTGAKVLEAVGEDSDEVPVVLALNDDVNLGGDGFEFRYGNLTIDGNGKTLSGTVVYTDDAGVVSNAVLGTADSPLVIDLTHVTDIASLGDGIVVENVTLLVSESHAADGTEVFAWNPDDGAPSFAQGGNISVVVVDANGEPTGDDATLSFDMEEGVAYLGTCVARLTGPTHENPVYTSLAGALARAAQSGDTITLLADVTDFSGTEYISKSLTIDGAGHTIAAAAAADGAEMFDVTAGTVVFKNVTLDGAHKYTYCVQTYGAADLTLDGVTVLHGAKEWAGTGFCYGAGVHVNGGSLVVTNAFTAFSGGKVDEAFPFTGILYDDGGVHFANGVAASIANPDPNAAAGDTDLLLVGLVGAPDVSTQEGRDYVQAMLDYMNVPAGFYPYTLKIDPDNWDDNTSFTGASPLGWNDIIDYGKAIMDAINMSTTETPVEVGLLTDTEIPGEFVFEDPNFSVNGNGNVLSGTIRYTDNAGVVENAVLGTDDSPLVIDLTHTTDMADLGGGIVVENVVILVNEANAVDGTVVFDWGADDSAPTLGEGSQLVVTVVDENGNPTGNEVSLAFDMEAGIAYIGSCEARLTGPTHEAPVYTTLAGAISRAAQSGDTVTLLADVETSLTFRKSLTLAGEHKITGTMKVTNGASVAMEGLTLDANGMIYALDIAGGASVAMTNVTVGGGQWCNVHVNGGSLTGVGVTMLGDEVVVAADGQTFTYRGETLDAADAPFGMNLENVKGKTVTLPFMDIVRENGDETIDLADAQDKPLTQAGSILYLANMPGNDSLDGVTLPLRFYSYTLTIEADIGFLGDGTTPTTGWAAGDWNEIIDTGALVLDAIGKDSDEVPVLLTLDGDTDLGEEPFEFHYGNLTVDGGDHVLSGTIVYTDNAGVVSNAVLGTADSPLVIDLTQTMDMADLGGGIVVENVVILIDEAHATDGTVVFDWGGENEAPTLGESSQLVVTIVDENGNPTGADATLSFDMEAGVAYLGTCVARLTGPTHEAPIYTSLAGAIAAAAAEGDTVTLLTNITGYTETILVGKSLTINGAGHTITAAAVPEGGHRDMINAFTGGTSMLKIGNGAVTVTNITFDGHSTHAYTYLIEVVNSGASLTVGDISLLNGGELDNSGTPGAGYGAAIHVNNASLIVKDGFYACTGGAEYGVFPFTGILPEGNASVKFELVEDSDATPTVGIGDDLLLVGMIGAIDHETAQGILDYMKVPSRFIPYTLTLGDGSDYAFTGASPRTWNDIIEYGKAIMDVSTSLGFSGLDKETTPVEVGLLTDTVLPDTFIFEDSNFSVNGNGNALSGTIKYTDNAGTIKDLTLGTDGNALTLDLTEMTRPVSLGEGIAVSNLVLLISADHAGLGTEIFTWTPGAEEEIPDQGAITIQIAGGGEAELVWDMEAGVAYIGPCEARVTGPTHEKPHYATLTGAIAAALSGDTVEVITNVTLSTGLDITKSITLTGPVDAEGKPLYTITGAADLTSATYGDIYVTEDDSAVSVTISSLKLVGFGSEAAADGSSVVTFDAYDSNSSLTLTNLDFAAYNSYAVATYGDGLLKVLDCAIDGASATGGIYVENGATLVKDVAIANVVEGVVASYADVAIVDTAVETAAVADAVAVGSLNGSYVTIDGGSYAGALDVDADSVLEVSAGLFDRYVDEIWCAEGMIAVPYAPKAGWYEVRNGSFVASVTHDGTTTPFASFDEAVAAAVDGDTVTLFANTDVSQHDGAIDIAGLTIDLNGYEVTNGVAWVGQDGVISNGTMVAADSYGVVVGDGTKPTGITLGDVTAVGGVYADNNAEATIESGTYTAGADGMLGTNDTGRITITGGSFGAEVPEAYIAEGYVCDKEGDWYVVNKLEEFTYPEGDPITNLDLLKWLHDNGFDQDDIDALKTDDKLDDCYYLNCDITVANAGGSLNITSMALDNGVVTIGVSLTRVGALEGGLNGKLYIYGAEVVNGEYADIAAAIDDDDFSEGTSTTATFTASETSARFFRAVLK